LSSPDARPRREIPPTRRGYDFFQTASSLQKAVRRCDEEAALYWTAELDISGFGTYVWRRLKVICSEDVGVAEPNMPAQIAALYDSWLDHKRQSKGDTTGPCRLFLVHAVLLMARAKKSHMVETAATWSYSDQVPRREIPDVAIDRHTLAGKKRGRGMEHFWEHGSLLADPLTGELTKDGAIPDPFRERAEAATKAETPTPTSGSTRRGGTVHLDTSDERTIELPWGKEPER
jgi:replication-associated recombination protein RarA